MEDIKSKTLLFYDISGNFVSFAQRLSREYGHVLYYTNWKTSFPCSNAALIGEGLDGIERINNFWDYLDMSDIFFFADCYDGDLQNYLASIGKRVWGARNGDALELDRIATIKLMQQLGLPVPKVKKIIGLPKLREFLKENEGVFVKVSTFRGDFETFGSPNYKIAEPILDELEHRLGAKKLIEEFNVFEGIDAVCETGIDCFTINGQYPKETIFGFEIKDSGYGAKVKPYADISPLITDFNEKIAPTLNMYNYRGFFSTEIRVDKDRVPYMIDFTARLPAPPSSLMQELFANLGEIVWAGAGGEMIEPVFNAQYGIEIIIRSSWAEKNWTAIYFPEEIRQWVKLKNHTIIKGTDYFVPQGNDMCEIGSVVAIGNSIEDCAEKVKGYIDQIKGYSLDMNADGIIDKLQHQIDAAETVGIKF